MRCPRYEEAAGLLSVGRTVVYTLVRSNQLRSVKVGRMRRVVVASLSIGGPLRGNNLERRHFGPLMRKAGVPRIRFHDLRHTAATLMLAEGVPVKVVSEMLGHADVATTLRVYAHVMPTMQRAAVSVLGRLLGGS